MSRVVVVTGASGGVGRAVAQAFGAKGDRVALLARGELGLEAASKEVEAAGGTALAIPVDVAHYQQVDAAAARVERELDRDLGERRLLERLRAVHRDLDGGISAND